jgi:hypothetical protein
VTAPWRHLARRFFGSLRPGGPPPSDEAWVASLLLPGGLALWRRMGGADRRHAVGVARLTEAALPPPVARPIVAAALLHDVGKISSGLGPFRRALATLAGMAVSRDTAVAWRSRSGPIGRAGRYLCHDAIGAEMLAAAGSDPVTVAWAREHHLAPARWTVPVPVGEALKLADDD